MVIELSTLLDASPERIWEEVNRPSLLRYVAHPLVRFEPISPPTFPERWEEGEYRVRIWQFGIIPLGWQVIRIERPEGAGPARRRQLRDNGSGALAWKWDHLITVEPEAGAPGRTRYTDRVEIEAGALTVPVSIFARVFYGHRQRRWRYLVRSGFDYGGARPTSA